MKIRIKNKNYIGQCNALSYIFYKRIFKTNIFEDLEDLRESLVNISENNAREKDIAKFYKIIVRLIYILIYTKNQDIEDFEEWIGNIEIKDLTEDLTEDLTNKTIEIFLENFIDEEVVKELEKIPNNSTKTNIFPEHEFLKICLDYGLSIQDLRKLTYVDIIKIFISSYMEKQEEKVEKFKEATQADWDRLASL